MDYNDLRANAITLTEGGVDIDGFRIPGCIIGPDVKVTPAWGNEEAGVTLTIRAAQIIVNGIGEGASITVGQGHKG